MIIFGILGLLIISYSIWDRKEKRQDVLYVAGGVCLLAYSIWIQDTIFIILQIVFILSALLELVKLFRKKK
ncbi:MAG: YgjV family protein [Patescibacteria group bacterium]